MLQQFNHSFFKTGLVPLLFVRFVVTRNQQSYLSANCHSSVSSVRLPRTSRVTCASRDLPSSPFRRLRRLTLLVSSRTPTCAPFTPSVSPSCPKTFSWPGVFVESVLKSKKSSYLTQQLQLNFLPSPTLHFLREAFFIVPPLPLLF